MSGNQNSMQPTAALKCLLALRSRVFSRMLRYQGIGMRSAYNFLIESLISYVQLSLRLSGPVRSFHPNSPILLATL